jgi:hypothetical protein
MFIGRVSVLMRSGQRVSHDRIRTQFAHGSPWAIGSPGGRDRANVQGAACRGDRPRLP